MSVISDSSVLSSVNSVFAAVVQLVERLPSKEKVAGSNPVRRSMIPTFLKSCLRSYHPKNLDKNKDKERIIFQVLNFGNFKSIRWLFKNYSLKEIKNVLKSKNSSWHFLSYSFWCKILKIKRENINNAFLPSFRKRNKENIASI